MDRPAHSPSRQVPGYDISELDHLIEDESLQAKYHPEPMRVQFETPSGFAIFGIDSGYLYDVGSDYTGTETIWVHCVAKESADFFVWLRAFLKVDNRSAAITATGIDNSLVDLIEEMCNRGQKLIVGEPAYKEAIENLMGITCICYAAAEELMWALQNLLHELVPEEKSEFGEQDRRYHSKKLLGYLRHNVPEFDIKSEMINGRIALLASFMRRCDVASKEYAESMHTVDYLLTQRSPGLETGRWDAVTHATALMTLLGESVVMPDEMFTDNERKTILEGVGKYEGKIMKANVQTIYRKVVRLNKIKFTKRAELMVLLQKASRGNRHSGEMLTTSVLSEEKLPGAEGHEQRKKLKVGDDDVQSGATMD